MPKNGRKTMPVGPRNAWEAQLERIDGDDPTQAGEIEPGLEAGDAGGDKGIDADTGSGGYSGDIVERGLDDAEGEPEKPLDVELGDPRTREGESYPDEAKRLDPYQKPPAGEAEELRETDGI